MMNFLSLLPEYVVLEVFSDWCEAAEIVKFDSALCNKYHRRKYFLEVLKSEYFVLTGQVTQYKPSTNWITLREIKLKCLSLNLMDFSRSGNEFRYPQLNTSKVEVFEINSLTTCVKPSVAAGIINGCPTLRSISIAGHYKSAPDVIKLIDQKILQQLTGFPQDHFTLNGVNADALLLLTRCCFNLKNISFSMDNDEITSEQIMNLLKQNSKLTGIQLKFDIYSNNHSMNVQDILSYIAYYLPNLTSLILTGCTLPTAGLEISIILSRCKNMKSFRFGKDLTSGVTYISKILPNYTSSSLCTNVQYNSLVINKYENIADIHEIINNTSLRLNNIELNYISNLTDDILYNIAQHTTLQSLKIKNCGSFYFIASLQSILTNCQQLLVLEMYNPTHLTDIDFITLFSVPNNVTKLTISMPVLSKVTQETVDQILKVNKQMNTVLT